MASSQAPLEPTGSSTRRPVANLPHHQSGPIDVEWRSEDGSSGGGNSGGGGGGEELDETTQRLILAGVAVAVVIAFLGMLWLSYWLIGVRNGSMAFVFGFLGGSWAWSVCQDKTCDPFSKVVVVAAFLLYSAGAGGTTYLFKHWEVEKKVAEEAKRLNADIMEKQMQEIEKIADAMGEAMINTAEANAHAELERKARSAWRQRYGREMPAGVHGADALELLFKQAARDEYAARFGEFEAARATEEEHMAYFRRLNAD